MKATINGVTVEGTPQEIAEFVKLTSKNEEAPKTPFVPYAPAWPYPNATDRRDYDTRTYILTI